MAATAILGKFYVCTVIELLVLRQKMVIAICIISLQLFNFHRLKKSLK